MAELSRPQNYQLTRTDNAVLQVLQKASAKSPASASEVARLLGYEDWTVRGAINKLRTHGYNIRNRRGVGFWINKTQPAPPTALPGQFDGRWQD